MAEDTETPPPAPTPPTPVEVVSQTDAARLSEVQDRLRREQEKRSKRYGAQR